MAYTPKSARKIDSNGYMPKSAVPVAPPEEKSNLNLLDQVASLLGIGTSAKNVNLAATAPTLGKTADQTDEFIKSQFERSQKFIEMARNEKDPAKKKQLLELSRQVDSGMEDVSQTLGDFQKYVTDKGGVTESDLNSGNNMAFALKRGAGSSAEAASILLPGTNEVKGIATAAKGAGSLPRLVYATGMGAAQGALQGAAEGSVSSKDILDYLKTVGTGSLVGGATSGALQGLSEAKNLLFGQLNKIGGKAKSVFKKIYASTLKENISDQKFYKQAGGKDKVIEDAIRLKLPASKEGVRTELFNYGDEFNNIVDSEIAKSKVGGKNVDVASIYKRAKEETLKQLKDPESRGLRKQAESYFKEADKVYLSKSNSSVSLDSVNRLRKRLDSRVGEMLQEDISNGEAKAMKNFASSLRNEFKKELPQLKDSFRKYQLLSGLAEAMQKEPMIGITEATGMATGGAPGAIAMKIIRSPAFKRVLSSQLMGNIPGRSSATTNSMTPELLRSISSIISSRGSVK